MRLFRKDHLKAQKLISNGNFFPPLLSAMVDEKVLV